MCRQHVAAPPCRASALFCEPDRAFRVQAQEVLRSSRGALMWHGRDLRHFKRIISPPLQQLLTQPGTAVLGRGLASLPAETAHQMGAAQACGVDLRVHFLLSLVTMLPCCS